MSYFVKRKCRGCDRMVPPRELVTGLCGYCWRERISALTASQATLPQFSDGQTWRCMECNKALTTVGYWQYVKDADMWVMLCLECGDKKLRTDSQYRGTPFAFAHKIQ